MDDVDLLDGNVNDDDNEFIGSDYTEYQPGKFAVNVFVKGSD